LKAFSAVVLLSAAVVATAPASAQTYPDHPLRLVVPFTPGGPTDIIARTMGAKLTESLKQTVIVDNRAGGSGVVGTAYVAKAPADGYTMLLVGVGVLTINAAMTPKLPYDTLKDLQPLSILSAAPNVLVVHPSLPVRNLKQLIALAKAKPGQLNYASGGPGYLLGMEHLKEQTGMNIVHIPYKGAGLAMNDLVAGHVQVALVNMVAGLTMSKAGRVRALGVTSAQRSEFAPELPTLAESGAPEVDIIGRHMMLLPAGTPRPLVTRLHQEIAKILQTPEIRERLAAEGSKAVGSTPEEAAAAVQTELARWTRLVKRIGLTAEQ
jgi:tripartite-type tricarboxylate transporter receptor subunit TctC